MAAKRIAKKAAPAKKKAASAKKAAPAKKKAAPAARISPEELAARVAATGLVEAAHLLPWSAIAGPGAYAAIARALRDLAKGELPIEDIADDIDLGAGRAHLELRLDGVHHVLQASVRGGEVDDGVLVMLGALFESRQRVRAPESGRLFFVDPSTCKAHRTHLVICATFDAARAINAATGAAFIKLTEL